MGISVSKLCCPACCGVFRALRENHENHETQELLPYLLNQPLGGHTVPYPVQLPDWLPDHITEDMLALFRPRLMEALEFLVYKPQSAPQLPFPGAVHRSQQSSSNISVSSTNAEVPSRPGVLNAFNREAGKRS